MLNEIIIVNVMTKNTLNVRSGSDADRLGAEMQIVLPRFDEDTEIATSLIANSGINGTSNKSHSLGVVVSSNPLFGDVLRSLLESLDLSSAVSTSMEGALSQLRDAYPPRFVILCLPTPLDVMPLSSFIEHHGDQFFGTIFILLTDGISSEQVAVYQALLDQTESRPWHVISSDVSVAALLRIFVQTLYEPVKPRWPAYTVTLGGPSITQAAHPVPAPTVPRGMQSLSDRENQVLSSLKDGLSNKQIARLLNISEGTVKVHVKAVLKKVGARNRTQAAIWACNNTLAGDPAAPHTFDPPAPMTVSLSGN